MVGGFWIETPWRVRRKRVFTTNCTDSRDKKMEKIYERQHPGAPGAISAKTAATKETSGCD